jgi:hypothetical protein
LPDLERESPSSLANAIQRAGLDGIIATITTARELRRLPGPWFLIIGAGSIDGAVKACASPHGMSFAAGDIEQLAQAYTAAWNTGSARSVAGGASSPSASGLGSG